jgi:hypothetical protein
MATLPERWVIHEEPDKWDGPLPDHRQVWISHSIVWSIETDF